MGGGGQREARWILPCATRARHIAPEPVEHPGIVVVGDYLFDSTLNGVLRSANIATELLLDTIPAQGDGRGASWQSGGACSLVS